MGGRTIGAETKRDVVARLSHGAVAFVVVGAECDASRRCAIRTRHGRRCIADLQTKERPDERLRSLARFLLNQNAPAHAGLREEKCRNLAVVARFVFQTFWGRTRAEIVVTRQTCRTREMRLACPQCVVSCRVVVRLLQPGAISVTRGLLRVVDGENHGGQKRRL